MNLTLLSALRKYQKTLSRKKVIRYISYLQLKV